MKKFTTILSIIPNSTFHVDMELPSGADFYNEEARRLQLPEEWFVNTDDQLVQVSWTDSSRSDWTDQLPDELAASLGRPNLDPDEDPRFHERLRLSSLIPIRILETLKEGDVFTLLKRDGVTIEAKVAQRPFREIKTFGHMLAYVTR